MDSSQPASQLLTTTLFTKLNTIQFPGSTGHILSTQKPQVASYFCIGLCRYTVSSLQKGPLDVTALEGEGTPGYLLRKKVSPLTEGLWYLFENSSGNINIQPRLQTTDADDNLPCD